MSRRIALVVGVSEYSDFSPLPNSLRDAETIAHVLRTVACFDEVQLVVNPTHSHLSEKVEEHFTGKETDDLVLFYFSGHGVKDERGLLHLAVRTTRRHAGGEIVRASAVACQHVHDAMSLSRSRRQVVILDCCFSGAFAEGVQAKDGGRIDLRRQLGGEGRAVLASSSSTQYSFDSGEMGMSTYTQFLVQGIATGDADLNHDGVITVDELHEFAKGHVQSTRPAMSPQILPSREGYSIVISKARRADPRLAYAAKVREVADLSGAIPAVGAEVLSIQRRQLKLAEAEAQKILETELEPIRSRAAAKASLRKAVFKARRGRRVEAERSLLNELRVALDLNEQDLKGLLEEPIGVQRRKVRGFWYWPERAAAASAGVLCVGLLWIGYSQFGSSAPAVALTEQPKVEPASTERSLETVPSRSTGRTVDGDALDAVLRVDHSRTAYAIRISADNTMSEARGVAHQVLSKSRFQPWIVHDGNRGLYYVFVGGYSNHSVADGDRIDARSIVDPPGAIVTNMQQECPGLTWNPSGFHDCR